MTDGMSIDDDLEERHSLAALVERAAQRNPEGTAFIDGDRADSWRDVARETAALAAIMARLGLEPGQRVAVIAGVSRSHVATTFALSWAGLVVVPLNTRLSPAEHVRILQDADVAALLHDRSFTGHATAIADEAQIRQIIDLEDLIRTADPQSPGVPAVSWTGREIAAVLYTGGTTGSPKGVRMPADAFMVHGRNVMDCLGYDTASVVLHAQPIFHVAGSNQLYGITAAMGSLVFRADSGPLATYQEIAAHGVNSIGLVPTTLAMLLDHPARDDALLATIRSVVYGSAAITETLLKRALAAMPNAGFCQFYGQTEAGPVTALLPEDHVLSGPRAGKLRSAGRARPYIRLRVVDTDGQEVPHGTPGEIALQGAGLCDGYWRNPERTAELFRDGWLRTGDVGVLDDAGYVTIVDRFKDMIVTGGENVFCAEVEHVIATHPAVAATAVIGVPHDFWGEAVHAVVIAHANIAVTEMDIIAHCRSQIAGYKCPKSVHFRTEPFPMSGVGKILKHELRREYALEPQR